jgi:hypothetical protein
MDICIFVWLGQAQGVSPGLGYWTMAAIRFGKLRA